MPSRRSDTTTEQHQPPSADPARAGRPALLAAFPTPVVVSAPAGGTVVGRAWLAERGVRDREISSQHARLFAGGGSVQIEDMGSRNGTFVDGERLSHGERRALDEGAVLRLGRTLFVYRASFDAGDAPEPPLGRLVGPFGLAEVRARIARIKRNAQSTQSSERNVLIQGESGTGKELVAAAVIHALGRGKKSINVNVAGVASGVFEAQLFGWVKGAYSDSGQGSAGILRDADGGAVFLDEIGDLPAALQPKLLRAVENHEVLPVGATRPVPVDVAIVAATNRLLEEDVERGAFRRDLLARFTVRIGLPSLADRPEDLWSIFAELARRRPGAAPIDPERVEVEAVERMMLSKWPGNVRDLDRVVAEVEHGDPLALRTVERVLGASRPRAPLTREALVEALAACGGNQSAAARRLDVSWGTMQRRMKEWGLARSKG